MTCQTRERFNSRMLLELDRMYLDAKALQESASCPKIKYNASRLIYRTNYARRLIKNEFPFRACFKVYKATVNLYDQVFSRL